jgi:transmembrane protein DUF3566
MADGQKDSPIAPRRSLGGPILPPPPPELAEEAKDAERAKQQELEALRAEDERRAQKEAEKQSAEELRQKRAAQREAEKAQKAQEKAEQKSQQKAARKRPAKPAPTPGAKPASRRTRRAQLRLVQVDAWSVMKTSFLLSIALGIVLVVAVAIIWGVLGAAGVWDSINSIVQQAVGSENGKQFDIQEYAGTSRVLGFTMIVAVLDVILITAIATLGAFLYNLSAALLGGIEVTLAEDS